MKKLQKPIHKWHRKNYPNDDAKDALLAVGEELGELMRCQVKQTGKIRGTFEHWQQEKHKEVGDVLIGLINYCAWAGIDWQAALKDRWATSSQRDFIANPETGGREQEDDDNTDHFAALLGSRFSNGKKVVASHFAELLETGKKAGKKLPLRLVVLFQMKMVAGFTMTDLAKITGHG